jgi:adenylate kinase
MEKLIIITGTPGTGKSTLAKYLGEKTGAEVVGANEIAKSYGYVIGKDGYGTSIIDMKKLEKRINQIAKEQSRKKIPLIIEGHLLSGIKVGSAVVIVMREHLPTLIKRLEKRGYPFGKIRDNIISEALNLCGSDSRKRYRRVYEVLCGKSSNAEAMRIVRYGKGKDKSIDMMPELLKIIKKDSGFLS